MNPDVSVVIACLIFTAVVIVGAIGFDRWAAVQRDRNDVERGKDMSDKLVQALQSMSEQGMANNAIRTAARTVDTEGRTIVTNGQSQHRASEPWQQPRATAESR